MAILVMSLLAIPIWGSDLQLKVSAQPTVVKLGGTITYRISISGPDLQKTPALQLPAFTSFTVGESSEETTFKPAGGALQITRTRTIPLTAIRGGVIKLSPVEVRYKGKLYKSEAVTIEVKGDSAATDDAPGTDLIVRSEVSATQVVVGQAVDYRLNIYRQFTFKETPTLRPPMFQGFFQTVLPVTKSIKKAMINGKVYYVTEVIHRRLYPAQPGVLTINDAAITYRLTPPISPAITAEAAPISIRVMALPDPKPNGFRGAVGDFNLSVSTTAFKGTQFAPLSISFLVSGEGNLNSVTELGVPASNSQFKVIKGSVVDHKGSDGQVNGRRLTYVVIPQMAGHFTCPPFTLSVYSPRERRYKVLSTAPLHIHVKAGKSAVAILDNATQLPLRPLRPDGGNSPSTNSGMAIFILELLFGVNILLLVAAAGMRVRRDYRRRHQSRRDWASATDHALDQLARLSKGELNSDTIGQATSAVTRCLSAKLRHPIDGLQTTALIDFLATHGVSPDLIRLIAEWRVLSETLEFSPAELRINEIRDFITRSVSIVETTRTLGRSQ
jgi:hypothetical protein